jgi:CRISPR-associated protein Cmr4
METQAYLLHALSPLHAGTGQGAGLIDLPVARMRATGIPFVPGSSVKGVLRADFNPGSASAPERDEQAAVYGPMRDKNKQGPEGDTELEHAGALVVGDARLLALPVRAFLGTFAYVTSPLLLELARRDCKGLSGFPMEPLALSEKPRAFVADPSAALNARSGRIYLEELSLQLTPQPKLQAWAEGIARALPEDERELFRKRFVVVDDDTMDFLCQTATQIDTRIRLNQEKGTVEQGALWTEESLPAETLLIGVMAATSSLRRGVELNARGVLDRALPQRGEQKLLQLGGKATVGRGLCRLMRWPGEAK